MITTERELTVPHSHVRLVPTSLQLSTRRHMPAIALKSLTFIAAIFLAFWLPPGAPSRAASPAEQLFGAEFKDFSGALQPMAQYKGKPLIVYFWATWCESCKREIPMLIDMQKRLSERNLQIVGIAVDQADKVKKYAEQYGINYPLLIGGTRAFGGTDAVGLSRTLGNTVGGLPFMAVFDRDGKIVKTFTGETERKVLEETLTPLLG